MYVNKTGVLWAWVRAWRLHLAILAVVSTSTVVHVVYSSAHVVVSGVVVSVVGTAISFFIGFLNAQAYDRWWEARKIWGAFVNDSRSFARMALTFLKAPDASESGESHLEAMQKALIHRHIAFLYAVKSRLRGDPDGPRDYLTAEEQKAIAGQSNRGNAILGLQGQAIVDAEAAGYIDEFRMTRLNEMLTRFSDSMGMAERIKLTVFPMYYTALIRVAIWLFLIVLPMTISEAIGYWAILFGYLLGVVFVFTFAAGQALMNPFDGLASDTPMTTITRSIEIDLLQQLGDEDIPDPIQPIRGQYLP